MIDGFVSDDIVAGKHPTQPEDVAIGKVTHAYVDTIELSMHYWGSSPKNLAAAVKPE